MNEPLAICTIAIIVATCIFSAGGFRDPAFRDKYLFSVPGILAHKEYHRLFTSALLHADMTHLLMNMVTLFLFGRLIEIHLGVGKFVMIYLVGILGGGVLSLWIHRHHDYKAYGASGGVCGLIFSYIVAFPGAGIMMFPLPFWIPAWLYAILFMLGSTVALRRQADNIGHDAHLGGAILAFWTTAAMEPDMVRLQPKLILTISILAVLLFVFLVKLPLFMPFASFLPAWQRQPSPGNRSSEPDEEAALDAILDKISRKGLQSLSRREKALLDAAAKKRQGK